MDTDSKCPKCRGQYFKVFSLAPILQYYNAETDEWSVSKFLGGDEITEAFCVNCDVIVEGSSVGIGGKRKKLSA